MYGLFQTTFYFGYMALFSVGLGIMCGMCKRLTVATWFYLHTTSLAFITDTLLGRKETKIRSHPPLQYQHPISVQNGIDNQKVEKPDI